MAKSFILGDRAKTIDQEQRDERVRQQRREDDDFVKAVIDMELPSDLDEAQLLEAKKSIDEARNMVAEASNAIASQIDEATLRKFRDHEYADPTWWRKINGAQRAKGWQKQRLQEKLGEVTRRLKDAKHAHAMKLDATRQKSRDRMFVEAAKLHLTGDMYQRIWDTVEQIFQKQERGEK